jgi:hypothetical protein
MIGTIFLSVPWLCYQTWRFAAPYVALERLISTQKVPMVMVDTFDPAMMVDQVRNLPDLSNRPIRLSSRVLTPGLLAKLCTRGTIAIVTRAEMHRAGMALQVPEKSPKLDRLLAETGRKDCFRPLSRPQGW